jgi:hypothetical protein
MNLSDNIIKRSESVRLDAARSRTRGRDD